MFTIAACGGGDIASSGGGATSASLGATLNLSGPVWTYSTYDGTFERFEGYRDLTGAYDVPGSGLNNVVGRIGSITTEGELSYTIGVPGEMINISESLNNAFGWRNINNFYVSNNDTMGVTLEGFLATPNGTVQRWNYIETAIGEEDQAVFYIYVDRDLTVSGARTVSTETKDGFTATFIINAFNINLITGWNAVYQTEKEELTGENSGTGTFTVSAANPGHLRWIIRDHY